VHTNYPLVKIFGSCFGHQVIAQALFSESARSAPAASTFHVEHSMQGFEMGIQPITLDPSFTANFPPLVSPSPFRIQLIHGDQVVPTPEATAAAANAGKTQVSLPAPWMNIGSSAACPIQGLYNPGRVLSYQGHFEFDTFVNRELCQEFGRRANWSTADVASYVEHIERSLVPGQDDDDDSKAAAEAVLLFFAGEDQPSKLNLVAPNGMITPPLDSPAG
jgi:GMP synthase-like glutamine amidotransferase